MKSSLVLTFIISLISIRAFSQNLQPRMLKPKHEIVCYASDEDQHTHVAEPESYRLWKERAAGRTKSANIEVTYIGFTIQAQTAFQHAVDIWETLIESDVTIRITANWQPLSAGVLGSAIWGSVHANFPGAQRVNTWYPAALAEKMAGYELNDPTEPDIFANFSSSINWYLNPTGTPAPGQYDFITVVMHEIGHGLGFTDSYSATDQNGFVGVQTTGLPIIYDQQLENQAGQNIFRTFNNGTTQLKSELTSNNVYYNSSRVLAVNGNERARLYAPATYDGGSSIAHLNESSYLAGTANSLLTPQIAAVEVNHNPGPVALAMLSDMGWKFTRIAHTQLKDTETISGSFVVKAVITSDVAPVSQIKLFYNIGGANTEMAMTPTVNPNEYQASIPATGTPTTYRYFISVNDNLSRNYTSPGKLIQNGQAAIQQFYHVFSTGPDTQAPRITHAPKSFIQDSESTLEIEAIISDNLGLATASVEYKINNVAQTPITMSQGTPDSLYTATINVSALSTGDVLEYRIKATDVATSPNTAFSPSSDYYELNVVGLVATEDFYQNDFNSGSADFFGDGFSITTPTGFTNGAIHSTHPYPEGTGFPNDELNLVYQLKVPIRISDGESFIRFDEIVLVEPGESGSEFGDDDFYDYVVVEGSTDGGVTWQPVADGYDSRASADWLARYNSGSSGNNSTGTGDPALYRPRTIDLREVYEPGEVVAFRFRLFSDPFARGWGWAIDNLRIQTDEVGPTILHDHHDFVKSGTTELPITIKVGDDSGVKSLTVEFKVNQQPTQEFEFAVLPNVSEYTLNVGLNGLTNGDVLSYRIVAVDSADNEGLFPPQDFIKVSYVDLPQAIDEYVNDFTSTSSDFAGNFFSQAQVNGFNSSAIHSEHPYQTGFGLDTTSNLTYTLLKPIKVDGQNPYIQFDEVVLVEGQPGSVDFGSDAFNDYVIVEGSSDEGQNWFAFTDGYDATAQSAWQSAIANNTAGNESLYRTRMIDMLETGDFADGDEILIRFRLFSNKEINAWGWAIDNLSIQSVITAAEYPFSSSIRIFPNPVGDVLTIELMEPVRTIDVECFDVTGKKVDLASSIAEQFQTSQQFDVSHLPPGLYMMRITADNQLVVKKVWKK